MSKNPSALASLTANYTDSENEEGHDSDDNSPRTEESSESQVIFPASSKPTTPVKTRSVNSTPSKAKSGLRLVSYHDDTVISDDDNDDDSPTHEDIEMETSDREAETEFGENNENVEPTNEVKRDRVAEYGFALPPEPKGKCPQELQEKINKMYEKMKTQNMNMNKLIQERKEFRNPSIYEKLIQYCDIDELGTNYPPEIYDPMQWTNKESFYYEELAKVQKTEMDKREKEFSKTDMVHVKTKKAEEDAKKRKSKWDQPAPSAVAIQQANVIKSSGLITTSITGTKGTVISAFGSLPKKSKP
ncbi:SAP30-binding protein [Contarinia nasturtii]|uniref:SAP30-binding protein n=1 Tax=Contarinia nasturtii TaxID=265458 RepID=UPI0012D42FF3|nr:SAP30-binding protein [Contarinia nasturtii]